MQCPRSPAIDIVSCAIHSLTPHPRLSGRVDAVVRVHLKEVVGGLPAEHSIALQLRVSVEPGDHAERVKELVLAKTAKILRSVKGALESTSGEVAPPAAVPAEMPIEMPAEVPEPAPVPAEEPAEAQVRDQAPSQDPAPAPGTSDYPDPGEDQPVLPAGL
jgi:hypothetical protein